MEVSYYEQEVEVVLTPNDVESAVRQFICTCHPQLAIGWVLNANNILRTVVFTGNKQKTNE